MKTPKVLINLVVAVSALAFGTVAGAQVVPVFSEDFDRADGAVGNGWSFSSSGNGGGGGGTAPIAVISDNRLSLERKGWGPDAKATLTHSTDDFNTLTANIVVPSLTGGTAGGDSALSLLAVDQDTGAYIRVALVNSNTNGGFGVRLANSTDGTWPDWTYYYPASGNTTNPGEVSVSIHIGEGGLVSVSIVQTSDDTLVTSWTGTNTSFVGANFDQIRVIGNWTAWTSPNTSNPLYIDNIQASMVTSNIPEPSSFACLAGLTALGAVASRRRQR